jgi:hypothetical protein
MGAGRRNDFLASEAGKLRRIGCTAEVIAAALHVLNAKRCKPPLEPDEVEAIAKSVGRYDEAPESTPPVDILRTLTAPRLRTADVPEVLARFAEAQARATGFDESILLAAGVAAAGAALSDDVRLCVAPSSSWFESPRLWVAIVGGSGSGKSPGIKAMLSPIFAMHREGIAAWQSSHKGDDDAPPAPKLYVNDATVEALADVLAADSRGLLYSTDELTAWLGAHDAYRNGAGKDRGEWLRLYDGGPHQVERVSRGSTFVRNWGVSLLSATTHVELRRLAPRLPADGLLQRFLLVLARPRALPDTAMLRIDTRHPTEAWDAALRRLYAIEPCVVHLSGGAREIFQAEQSALHDLTQAYEDLLPPLAAHVAKRPAMLARLALTFHALQAVDVTREVSAESMTLAARFLRRQERHALAIYSSTLGANDTGIALARDIARSILASRLQSFNRRDLTPACKAFRNADEPIRQAALTHLHDAGWITADAPSIAHGARWNVDVRVHDLYAEHGEAARKRRETVRARILDDASND